MKSVIDEVLVRLIEELNIEYPLYDGHSLVSQDDLREIIGEVYKLRKTIDIMNIRLQECISPS